MNTNNKRYFNTSGPNIIAEHYTLMREDLIAKGKNLVQNNRYFTIWAPRQTGKSTYFFLLKTELEKQGYKVMWTNLENFKGAALTGLLRDLHFSLDNIGLIAPKFKSFDDLSDYFKKIKDEKIVLIIDEIEGLNPALFGQFLHTFRNLYHSRTEHCLKSVILVGVSNITGVVEDNASPFNISDNLNVPFFTEKEVLDLFGQHENETGQLFSPEVKAKIADITACQPGLINAFAAEVVQRSEGKSVITMEDYLVVENWFLKKAIDKNISNIINKAKQHREFVERLLFSETKVPFDVDRPEVKTLYLNGIIDEDEDGNVAFKVPLYRKRLHKAFYPYTNGEHGRIVAETHSREYFLADGQLNFDKWIANYKAYVQRRSFKYFREKDAKGKYVSLKEAALVYSFETYVAAFLEESGGKSYLEAHIGLGRTDLLINLRGFEYIVEFKVYSGESNFLKGQRQLAYYCKKAGLTRGEYLIFIPKHLNLPDTITENLFIQDGVTIHSWLVFYDEEKDF
jgi:hypothetical protein